MPSFLFVWRDMYREYGPEKLSARAVGLALSLYADTDSGRAHPQQSRLAADLASGTSTISRALTALEESGWLRRRKSGRTCVYQLTIPDELDPEIVPTSDDERCPERATSAETLPTVGNKTLPRAGTMPRAGNEQCPERATSNQTLPRAGTDDAQSGHCHKNSQRTHMHVQRSAERAARAAHMSTDPDPPKPTPADEVQAFFDQVVAGHELDEKQASKLADGLESRGVDPIRYLERREDDGIYGRVRSTPSLIEMLLDDAGAEIDRRDAAPAKPADGLEESPEPETFDSGSDPQADFPPDGFEQQADAWLDALAELDGEVHQDTLGAMHQWAFRLDGDVAQLAARDPVQLLLRGEKYRHRIADALGVDQLTFHTEEDL